MFDSQSKSLMGIPAADLERPLMREHIAIRHASLDDIPALVDLFATVVDERLWLGTQPGFDRERIRAGYVRTIVLDEYLTLATPGMSSKWRSVSSGQPVCGSSGNPCIQIARKAATVAVH